MTSRRANALLDPRSRSACCRKDGELSRQLASFGIPTVLAFAFAATAAEAAPADCKFVRLAEWPVRLERNQVLVDGSINGQSVDIKLDTGSTRTLILHSAAARLGLTLRRTRGRMFGVGGETDLDVAYVEEFKIGEIARENWRMLVAGEHDRRGSIAVLLGEDFFHTLDIEFDLAHRAVRLFQPKDCEHASLAYWATDGAASVVKVESVDPARPQVILTVRVNGHPVKALLDSGASASVLSKQEAAAAGVVPETAGVLFIGNTAGLGSKLVATWVAPFESVQIGDEVINDTTLSFADLFKGATYTPIGSLLPRSVDGLPSMLLGTDFLLAHRVLISHSQQKLYFTYTGGPVFRRAGPLKPADDVPPRGAAKP
jgi:predicted aspartyl protease